jgi:hypothetical protein
MPIFPFHLASVFLLALGSRTDFLIIRDVTFKTAGTNSNTIVILEPINKLLTVFVIGNKVKEPRISAPFQDTT